MAPVFSSPKQAAIFALLLLTILLMPLVGGKSILPSRSDVYAGLPWKFGPSKWIHRQIFVEKGDLDVAFVGSSHILCDIDTPAVQREFSKGLQRPASVVSLSWQFSGYDVLYFVARDLLEHRKVRMLVIYDEFTGVASPHWSNSRLCRWGDAGDALAGLPFQTRARFYSGAVLATPLNLVQLARRSIAESGPGYRSWYEPYHCPDPAQRLGSMRADLNFDCLNKVSANLSWSGPFIPSTGARPEDAIVYSHATAGQFEFPAVQMPPAPLHFARKLAALANQYGVKLVVLKLPKADNLKASTVSAYWPEELRKDAVLVGIPPSALFAGLSSKEAEKLFFDQGHFNSSGQDFFTPLITPRLLEIFHEYCL